MKEDYTTSFNLSHSDYNHQHNNSTLFYKSINSQWLMINIYISDMPGKATDIHTASGGLQLIIIINVAILLLA